MDLYLVRHAEAAPVGGPIKRDTDRSLTARGEEDAALMGRSLARIDPNIDIIVTSPLVRAVRTGEIIGGEISDHPIFHTTEHLAPGFRQRSLWEELLALSGGASIVVVGHQPDLGMFISYLIADSSRASVALSPCSIAHVKVEAMGSRREAHLRWLLTPEIARSLHEHI